MIMSKKYAVHPEKVKSKTDGQFHFISAHQLMKLFKVDPTDCVVCHRFHPVMGIKNSDYIHLSPQYDGNYKIKEQ